MLRNFTALLNVKSCIKDSSVKQFYSLRELNYVVLSKRFHDSACIANFEALEEFKGFIGLKDVILNDLLQLCFRPSGR